MIEKVIFFNSWHFGDLHSNKEYVRQFCEEFESRGIPVEYATMVSPRAVNLPIMCVSITQYPHLMQNPPTYYDEISKTMYINTWIGYYLTMHGHNFQQQIMWKELSNKVLVSSLGEISIPIKDDTLFYASSIDVELLSPVVIPEGKKVLFCNDIPVSGQSHNGNWKNAIENLAKEFPDINFICTNYLDLEMPNVFYTNILTNRNQITCDLPEIAHISESCDVIITNSSGPGTFSMTKNNFLNENKVLIGFLDVETNAYWYGVENVKAKTLHYNFYDDENVFSVIKNVLINIKLI
jgi:hypothetical protein